MGRHHPAAFQHKADRKPANHLDAGVTKPGDGETEAHRQRGAGQRSHCQVGAWGSDPRLAESLDEFNGLRGVTFHASYRPTLPLTNDKTGAQIQAQEPGFSEDLGAAGCLGQVHGRQQGPGRPRHPAGLGASRWSLELPAPLRPHPAPVSAIPVLASSTTPHQTAGSGSGRTATRSWAAPARSPTSSSLVGPRCASTLACGPETTRWATTTLRRV